MEPGKWEGVVAEAARQFARYGFRKTSIDEVARAAGIAKGTVYLGCESKRDLFYQAILRDLRLWHAELGRRIDPRVPADRLLVSVSREALAIVDRFPLARDLMLGLFDPDIPDWADRLDELRAEGMTTVLAILRLGVRQGRFRARLDLEAVAGVFLDLMVTTIMYHARGPDAEARAARHQAAAFDLVLDGLRPRTASPSRSRRAITR